MCFQYNCQKVLKELASAELGTHLHSDFIGPMKTLENMAGYNADACQTDYPEEVEFQKLRNLTNLFSDVFEQKPRVFRAGRFSANLNTLKALHSLGYLVDSSFTPYCTWLTPKGNLIDHSQTPEEPYFPDLKNEDESSSPQLLEIPLTIVKRKIPLRQKVSWLRPVFSSPTAMKRIIRNKAASPPSKYPKVLNMMFHSEELVPCASPYTKNKADIDKYVSALKRVFDFAILKGCKFATQEEIYKKYSSIYLSG